MHRGMYRAPIQHPFYDTIPEIGSCPVSAIQHWLTLRLCSAVQRDKLCRSSGGSHIQVFVCFIQASASFQLCCRRLQRMLGPASVSRILKRNCSVAFRSTSSSNISYSRKHVSATRLHSCHRLSLLITAKHEISRRIHTRSCVQQDISLVQECSTANWNTPLKGESPSDAPVSVALGKFDGMHQGHRLLAERAAASGAHPYLLSFSGMAEVLGWPARLPLVAPNDRARVLASWTTFCHGRTPQQRYIPFSMVRSLSPEAFVKVLARDLQVSGVVVGQNYRFG